MKNKICTKCNTKKPISEFYKRKDVACGVRADCKDCVKRGITDRDRTKDGLVKRIYYHQRTQSRCRGMRQPTYSVQELIDWAFSQRVFHELYNNWVVSDYDIWEAPSFDRLDNFKSYTLDNLRIVTWRENKQQYDRDLRDGVNNTRCKAVESEDIDSGKRIMFNSMRIAERETGVHQSMIWKACNGVIDVAGECKWRYV